MKIFLLITFLIINFNLLISQEDNPNFDKELSLKLGADELGMKTYIMVILKTGTAQITDSVKRKEMFRGHFDNINKLAAEGKLVIAGPINKNERTYRGIFVFNVKDEDEARKLMEDDLTIVNRIFEVEYYKWYASAALMEVNNIHNKISTKKP